MSGYVVRFDRLGRTHNPPDLTVPASGDEGLLAELIERHARRFCMSADIEAICTHRDDAGQPIRGSVLAGFRNAGEFTIEPTP